MKVKKVFKFKKGDIVYCSAFVFTQYERDILPPFFQDIKIIHTPETQSKEMQSKNKKVLVRTELAPDWKHPFLVVAIKQIQTGYYYAAVNATSNWTGEYDGEPAEFYPDKFHDVYVLESLQSQRWSNLDYALEEDLRSER
jgi:hypothetical protein